MRQFSFNKARFLKSAMEFSDFPPFQKGFQEIAIVGKSNVGKSSLINFLLKTKKLAKVSSTPGKTQMINFFVIDESLMLVDLPGYGYARVSKEIQENWATYIEGYFQKRENLSALLQLIDIRRLPTKEDLSCMQWCRHHGKPFFILFTKSDKLTVQEQTKNIQCSIQLIEQSLGEDLANSYLACSIKDFKSRQHLIGKINKVLLGR